MLTLAVGGGILRETDRAALLAAQSVAAAWLDLAGSVVGLFGQAEVTAGLALGLAAARARRRRSDAVVPLLIAVTVIVEAILKTTVAQPPLPPERARTVDLLPSLHVAFAYSFPSGHVARTAFLLGIANVPRPLAAIGLVLMIASRVYLAEHWLTDTIGGLLLGLGVARAGRTIGRVRSRRGQGEPIGV